MRNNFDEESMVIWERENEVSKLTTCLTSWQTKVEQSLIIPEFLALYYSTGSQIWVCCSSQVEEQPWWRKYGDLSKRKWSFEAHNMSDGLTDKWWTVTDRTWISRVALLRRISNLSMLKFRGSGTTFMKTTLWFELQRMVIYWKTIRAVGGNGKRSHQRNIIMVFHHYGVFIIMMFPSSWYFHHCDIFIIVMLPLWYYGINGWSFVNSEIRVLARHFLRQLSSTGDLGDSYHMLLCFGIQKFRDY